MYELFDLYFRKVWVIFLMTSVFSFWLRADNLEFGHINQVFLLLSTPVIFLTLSVFLFWLRADNLEFGHINQVFLLLSTPVIFLTQSVFLFCLRAIEIDMCVCGAKAHRTYISMLRVDNLEFPHIN